MSVESKSTDRRRELHFDSYQELLEEARRLAAQPTRYLGNWSFGEVCQHLAATMDISIDGPPFRPGLFTRLVGPFFKKRLISRPMSPGYKFPQTAKVLVPDGCDAATGLATLEKAMERLQQTPERQLHPILGSMTREEWDQLHLRHAEMHLGFILPE